MSTDKIIEILTEIRDQQRQQVENFQAAIQSQEQAVALQNRARKMFQFLVIAPWLLVVVLLAAMLVLPGGLKG